MARAYYHSPISQFLNDNPSFILGELARNHGHALEEQQRSAWLQQIGLLKNWLTDIDGLIVFEYSIPRMGRRIDCVVLSGGIVFAIEFKVGASTFDASAIDQVVDYALDLKNFHEQSHARIIVPILIATSATTDSFHKELFDDLVSKPQRTNGTRLRDFIGAFTSAFSQSPIDPKEWINSAYRPTPTIIQAAQALYRGHSVDEISRSDAGAVNLSRTADAIENIIVRSKQQCKKSICFLTGVPGAGKTLAGLTLANSWHKTAESEHAVFLSGNGPLVDVLQEALARNKISTVSEKMNRLTKSVALREAKAFIQNVHHFRDDSLNHLGPPVDRVVVFDEAQRAWTLDQTAKFMATKKGHSGFNQSEPEFLISVMDRHSDWATIVCLIGGGQEINTGEAGLIEWFSALKRSFPHWEIHISSRLTDHEYTLGRPLYNSEDSRRIYPNDDLHLSVSLRSFRSEKVSAFVKALLDLQVGTARELYAKLRVAYPILITRDLPIAKRWLRGQGRGSERYGLVASSGALRLKPYGIHVKADMDPRHWFLNSKEDVRSSYCLEDVATEFAIQGLELDWALVAWDADLRFMAGQWEHKSFSGTKWRNVNGDNAQLYLKNAYRVLLTRARQGMVLFVPRGSARDQTRKPEFYDGTFQYLRSIGVEELTA